MKRSFIFLMGALVLTTTAIGAENWKGQPRSAEFTGSVVPGLALVDGTAGFGVIASAAKKILNRGFVPDDINNQVFVELQAGPVFVAGSTAVSWSVHLRWDFHKDEDLSLYALGGIGGLFLPASLGSRTEAYPRAGIGVIWRVANAFSLRSEVSHELLGLGVSFEF